MYSGTPNTIGIRPPAQVTVYSGTPNTIGIRPLAQVTCNVFSCDRPSSCTEIPVSAVLELGIIPLVNGTHVCIRFSVPMRYINLLHLGGGGGGGERERE